MRKSGFYVFFLLGTILALWACSGQMAGNATSQSVSAESKSRVSKAYKKKIAKLKKQEKYAAGIASAQLKCGAGEKILAVAPADMLFENGRSPEADIYQYADGKVKHIAEVNSYSSAYPIAYTKKAVLYGGNHCGGKLVIDHGSATLYAIINMNIYGIKPELDVYSVLNGRHTLQSSKKLSEKKANDLYYYCSTEDGKCKGKVIEFN